MKASKYDDGIVNKSAFQNPRVLFVLRETNQYDQSLTEFLRKLFTEKQEHKKGYSFQMWHTIAKWACGIHTNFKDFSEINQGAIYKPYLQKVAVINLKKVSGGPNAIKKEIKDHANKNQDLIRNQIKEIEPDVIVACGTFASLRSITEKDPELESSKIKIIEMRHPSRANQKNTYNDLKIKYNNAYI